MSKISIQDIIDLAKAGYKPSDVKELFELADTADGKEKEPEAKKPEEPKQEEKKEPEETEDAFEKLAKS